MKLSNDIKALGTFIILNGYKGSNVAILGNESYQWQVSLLTVLCGVGAIVPLDKDWELREMKRYANKTNCNYMIFSEEFEDVAWNLYNDAVTPIQNYLCIDNEEMKTQWDTMESAIKFGQGYLDIGYDDYDKSEVTLDDVAIIQYASKKNINEEPILITHRDISLNRVPTQEPAKGICQMFQALEGEKLIHLKK